MAEQQQRRKHCRWRPSSPLSLLPSHHRRAAAALHLHSRQRCCCAALERTLRCCSREARPSCKTEKERKRASSFLSFFCFFNAFRRRQICSSAFTFFLVPSLSLPQKKNMTPSPYDSPRLSAAHPPWPGAFEAPPPTASSTLASPRGAGTARPQPQPQPQLQRPSSKKGLPLVSASLPSLRPPPTAAFSKAFPFPTPPSLSLEPPRSASGWPSSSPRGEKKKEKDFVFPFPTLARRLW